MTIALLNGNVLTDTGFREDVAVLLESEQISAILPRDDPRIASVPHHDLGGNSLLPGFIDVQVNGGGGVLFNNTPTIAAIQRIGQAHRRLGTTGFLPTLISDDRETMRQAIAAVSQAIAAGIPGVLGIHLEGPYIAAARKGTHHANHLRIPDTEEIALATSLDNGVTLLTLAPECVPITAIRSIIARGAIIAAGHTDGSYAEIRAGLDAGIRGFTHLYNAMSPLQGREPGAVGAALQDRDSWCGIIVDGIHVHPASLQVALAAKAPGKLFLVTDAMPPVGAESPDFTLYSEPVSVRDGAIRNRDGTLAGSALDMASAVRNTVSLLGLPLAEAARMASTWPAQFLGIDATHGRIAPGYRADLVSLDAAMQVTDTWIAGQRANHE
ncbi:MAG: N-acetylglucosamine-6-phosphate deacetylase [Xanthomonadaceae bacterium]|nr:N-acetylglucosamine-6-phosphate deacetylase [Xanthomonadaceae bacterium]